MVAFISWQPLECSQSRDPEPRTLGQFCSREQIFAHMEIFAYIQKTAQHVFFLYLYLLHAYANVEKLFTNLLLAKLLYIHVPATCTR